MGQAEPPLRTLVTGATGYLGGRLVPELLAAGHTVRCLARRPAKLADRPWIDRVSVVRGDLTDADSLTGALRDIDVAYYLVHALGGGADFAETDRRAARTFGERARAAGVRRIVYLGALIPPGVPEERLSPHLRSRAEVGRLLLASGVPTAVLGAAVIIGSGSASFEMLRHLTERLPVMTTPAWVRTRVQPIAVRDALHLLVGSARLPDYLNRRFDIGGPDVLTYQDLMRRYALHTGLRRRLILPVRVLSPRLSSLWVGLVTPVPSRLARPLVESLRHEVVCHEQDITCYVLPPPGGFLGIDAALRQAVRRVGAAEPLGPAERPAPADPMPGDPPWAGGDLYTDQRERVVHAPPDALWRVVEGIGGRNGWYSAPLAWAVRGWLDSLLGGVGLRRGRADPVRLRLGEALDFWRVEALERGTRLRLRAEMRLPGDAWLELAVGRDAAGRTVYRQRALYHPRGFVGHLYWWAVAPFHAWIFGGMVRKIAARAEASAHAGASGGHLAAGARP
ncbi:SDR family oxidoreductase [Streptomyces sp. DSM 44915]|uniref:SDR family oxidoreductase n=1 Tax=Streptomyces chisholmiae TaxID=3075540 RepID=A0ABU2JRQ4_9ACTN|nr:SDR family oxidoreductase [Streptomyces sp. DSM 44915]MDT0267214.1 SDR family oxidoreductase [Streptomyces sp. DSM 44915]